jgi:hypothetical protein
VFVAGVLISDIDNYANLLDMLITCQQSTDTVMGKYTILAGTTNGIGVTLDALAAGVDSVTYNFCLPLLSVLSLTNNYVPLFAMSNGPLRIELQVVSSVQQIVRTLAQAAAPVNKSLLTNIELVCNMIELSDSGMAIIKNSIGNQPLQWVCQDYRNYTQSITLNAADTTVSIPVPAKFNSLNSLFFTFRSDPGGAVARMANESNRFSLSEYFFRIGSKTLPTKSPNSYPEMFSELMRAFGCVADVNHETNLSVDSYTKALPQTLTGAGAPAGVNTIGAFYVGIDLESYSNTSMSEGVYTGTNTSNDDIFFIPRFGANAANTIVRVDAYALFDQLILIENGQVRVNY